MTATFGYDPLVASDVWGSSEGLRIGADLKNSGNEFAAVIQATAKSPTPIGDCEKAAAIIEAAQQEVSTPSSSRDLVALDARSTIKTGNPQGRVWGGFFAGHIEQNADGLATGIEVGVANSGSDQPNLDTPTSKVALSIVAQEFGSTGHLTAAIHITRWSGRPRYYHGIIVKEDAFVEGYDSDVICLIGNDNVPSFRLKPNGTLWFRNRKLGFRQVRDTVGNVVDALILEG